MFRAMMGLFRQDLAIDIGARRTRICDREAGILFDQATCLALRTDRSGQRAIVATGDEAERMVGRTPADMQVLHPCQGAGLIDTRMLEAFLTPVIHRIHGERNWWHPAVTAAIPAGTTPDTLAAVRTCLVTAGASRVDFVPCAIADAVGAGLPVERTSGHMVVHIGATNTRVSIISAQEVVAQVHIPGGGDQLDRDLQRWLREEHQLYVGPATARQLKETHGSALPPRRPRRLRVHGRCAVAGIPRHVDVDAHDIQRQILPGLSAIGTAVLGLLGTVAPALLGDVYATGLVLVGGGSQLCEIDRLLRDLTGLAVVRTEHPGTHTVRGLVGVLNRRSLLATVAA